VCIPRGDPKERDSALTCAGRDRDDSLKSGIRRDDDALCRIAAGYHRNDPVTCAAQPEPRLTKLCLAAIVARSEGSAAGGTPEPPSIMSPAVISTGTVPTVDMKSDGAKCTRRFILRFGLALSFLITVGCLPTLQAAAATTALSPDAIKTTFGNGVPFSSTSPSGARYTLVLKPDGTATRAPKQSKAPTAGTWHLSKDGYCSTWSGGKENCFTIEQNGTKYSVLDIHGQLAAVWSR